MSKIYVDIGTAKNDTNSALPKAKNGISNISSSLSGLKRDINYKVRNKNDISDRMTGAANELSDIASELQGLYYSINRFLDSYDYAEERIISNQFNDNGRSKSVNELAFDSTDKTENKTIETLLNEIAKILGLTSFVPGDIPGSLISLLTKKIIEGLLNKNGNVPKFNNTVTGEKNIFDIISDFFKVSGKGADKLFDKLNLDSDAAKYAGSTLDLSGNLVDYMGSLYEMFTNDYKSPSETTAGWLSLFEKSTKTETGLYKFFEKILHPYQASNLYDKYNDGMTGLKIIGSIAGFIKECINSYEVFSDGNSKSYDKAAQLIDFWGAGFKTIGNVYIATDCSSKVLQFVSKPGMNQILATELPKLSFSSTAEVAKKAKVAGTYIALGDVVFSAISGGVRKYGECMEDGKFTWKDAGSVGVALACDGLSAVGRGLTLGIVNVDGKAMSNYFESEADNFARGDSWAAKYIRDEEHDVVSRFLVSVGSGGCILVKSAAEGLASGAKIVGGWISSAWNKVF